MGSPVPGITDFMTALYRRQEANRIFHERQSQDTTGQESGNNPASYPIRPDLINFGGSAREYYFTVGEEYVTFLSPSSCAGRAVFLPITETYLSTCALDTSIGVLSTFQLTPSEQGGVVSEPV